MANKIWVYTIAYNEAHFVKNFLLAYKDAERIIVYDNMSSDNTVTLLKEDQRVEVRTFDSGGQIRDDLYLEIKNNCWKEARGIADWVIVVDFDEIFTKAFYPNIFELNIKENKDTYLIVPCGYMLYAEAMPLYENKSALSYELKGVYDTNSEKPCCFRPDKIEDINFVAGCHNANPIDENGEALRNINIIHLPEYKLLHFKYVNIANYFLRLEQYKKRMSTYNLKAGYGVHYTWSEEKHLETYLSGLQDSVSLFDITNQKLR